MAQEYWVCEKCGTFNDINESRCTHCHKKISKRELAEALNRIESEASGDDAFDRFKKRSMMSEEEFQKDLGQAATRRTRQARTQSRHQPSAQRPRRASEVPEEDRRENRANGRMKRFAFSRATQVKDKWARQSAQSGAYRIIHYVTLIALLISAIAFVYSLVLFVMSGHYSEVGQVFVKLFSSIGAIFKNTFNYFLNIQFSNNALARVGGIVGRNLMRLFTTIFDNILRFLSML